MEYIPLEKPIAELEIKIEELQTMAKAQAVNLDHQIFELRAKAQRLRKKKSFRHFLPTK